MVVELENALRAPTLAWERQNHGRETYIDGVSTLDGIGVCRLLDLTRLSVSSEIFSQRGVTARPRSRAYGWAIGPSIAGVRDSDYGALNLVNVPRLSTAN